ncbi:MAG: hypothetical protein ABSC06_18355 [Rhodopila sp.]
MSDEILRVRIDALIEEVTTLTLAVGAVQDQLQLLAEMNRRLIDALTPGKTSGDNQLAMALARLVQEVERQNRLLEGHTNVLGRFFGDMPSMVTASVLEGSTGLLAAVRDLPGKVLTAVRDGFR